MWWLERLLHIVAGAFAAALFFFWHGEVKIEGDFWANVAGAAIGGLITVGLALVMFNHERKAAAKDAADVALQSRRQAIEQALRHIRAIAECVKGGRALTINTHERIAGSLNQAADLATQKLNDQNLTDFPLRLSMRDAALIGAETSARLSCALQTAAPQDANVVPDTIGPICDEAASRLDELMNDYRKLRMVATLQ